MNKCKKPEIKDEDFLHNPLAGIDFKIIVNLRVVEGTFIKDGEELLPKEIELEKENITKVYTKPENRKVMIGLSAGSQRLFLWIAYELEHGRDYLWINKKRYMAESGITSINTYKRAIAELVRYNLIAVSLLKDVFWINPRLFFAGSRINKYPSHVEVYEPKPKTHGNKS